MTCEQYFGLARKAEESESERAYVAESMRMNWLSDQYGDDTNKMIADLSNIYKVAHLSIADTLKAAETAQQDAYHSLIGARSSSGDFVVPLVDAKTFRRIFAGWERAGIKQTLGMRLMIASLLRLVRVDLDD